MPTIQRIALLAILLASPVVPGTASAAEPAFVPTVSRLVKRVAEIETTIDAALANGNRAELDRLVAADFEQRSGPQPGRPVPRADWLAAIGRDAKAPQRSQFAVHDLGTAWVASYQATDASGSHWMLVDVFRAAGPEWQLAIRYIAPAGDAGLVVPGAGPDTRLDKKSD